MTIPATLKDIHTYVIAAIALSGALTALTPFVSIGVNGVLAVVLGGLAIFIKQYQSA